jgi:hypothetical protein
MTFTKLLTALIGAIALCSCMPPIEVSQPAGLTRVELSSSVQAQAEKGVKEKLKDPNSAQFSNLRAYQKDAHMIAVCGDVNAKNSYGGYVGATPFISYVQTAQRSDGSTAYLIGIASLAGSTESEVIIFYKMFPLCAASG